MATCKVPLSVELLNRAEKYVDKETIEKLKQISADSFAKKIQQVQVFYFYLFFLLKIEFFLLS